MMNARIRAQMDVSNPFSFQFIQNLKSIDVNSFDDSGPSVVFASPGMLQSGVSRQLFDRWATDPKNGVMIAGYAVEHTLAKEIMTQPKEVLTLEGRKQPLNCLVDYVSFSAHVDFVQNRSFIAKVSPTHIILVHGQKDEMGRLKSALMLQYKSFPENKRPTITMPPNQIEVKLKFSRRRSAKVMGSLADRDQELQEGEAVRGVLVTHNFHSKLVAPEDLATYTPLRVGSINSKLHVPFAGSIETLKLFLNEMFFGVEETTTKINYASTPQIVFALHGGDVKVIIGTKKGVVTVEWVASPAGDVVADSVIALIMHAQSSAASIRLTSQPCHHPREGVVLEENSLKKVKVEGDDGLAKVKLEDEENLEKVNVEKTNQLIDSRLRYVKHLLQEHFINVETVYEANQAVYEIETDACFDSNFLDEVGKLKCTVKVEFDDALATTAKITVECVDKKIAMNVQDMLQNAIVTASAVKTKRTNTSNGL